jgi:phosphoribosylformylglycinamidine cyclo-ligase
MDLLGGETAEHYRATDYDLAGFCTGIVEKNQVVDGSNIQVGDVVIGIESSGLHSNGYTLINDMLSRHKIFYKELPELLTPTTIYSPLIQHLLDEVPILGMAHITGGGIPENLPRCLPDGLTVTVDYNSWDKPEIFDIIQTAGEISEEEMKNVFNLGIGFCLVVPKEVVTVTQSIINDTPFGMKSWVIGEVS